MLDNPSAIVETVATALAIGQGQSLGDALGTMKVAGTKDAVLHTVASAFGGSAVHEGVVRLLDPYPRARGMNHERKAPNVPYLDRSWFGVRRRIERLHR